MCIHIIYYCTLSQNLVVIAAFYIYLYIYFCVRVCVWEATVPWRRTTISTEFLRTHRPTTLSMQHDYRANVFEKFHQPSQRLPWKPTRMRLDFLRSPPLPLPYSASTARRFCRHRWLHGKWCVSVPVSASVSVRLWVMAHMSFTVGILVHAFPWYI